MVSGLGIKLRKIRQVTRVVLLNTVVRADFQRRYYLSKDLTEVGTESCTVWAKSFPGRRARTKPQDRSEACLNAEKLVWLNHHTQKGRIEVR